MLKIKGISKIYELGKKKNKDYQCVNALKNVSINFRENEFVSVLGQSGCGKTTLLNIIGGLDNYTSGDLVIDGKSTKNFNDRDWDNYRNHKVGFVFQSYNLIPHLTVFENVELALTLSGISRQERKRRVVEVLGEVGLSDKITSRPNQLSGGQMQRVAIARALVNNPEIILADEPTGALDSKTSVQIMQLLKIISQKRLIVMVTHNPILSEEYSTRVVQLLDGEIMSDSNPYEINADIEKKKTKAVSQSLTKAERKASRKRERKSKMSYFTALSLSLKNLLTKKARTFLVSFAGSIGIIGIALILALSSGFQTYVNNVQETTLTAYPLSISQKYVDYTSLISSFPLNNGESKGTDKVYEKEDLTSVLNMMTTFSSTSAGKENKLDEFKTYIDDSTDLPDYINDLQYLYDYGFNIYTDSTYTGTTRVSPNLVFKKAMGTYYNASMYQDFDEDAFGLLYNNVDFLKSQYSLVAGDWPDNSSGEFTETAKNQVVLMLDNNNQISDYFLYALGLKNQNNLPIITHISAGMATEDDLLTDTTTFEYSDLLNLTFDMVAGDKYYTNNGTGYDYYDDYADHMTNNSALTTFVNTNKMDISLEVVGIIKANSEDVASANEFAVGFTSQLYNYFASLAAVPTIITEQLATPTTNIITGNAFALGETIESNLKNFGYINLDNPYKIKFFAKDFENKEKVIEFIKVYNSTVLADEAKGENYVINYTDLVGLLISNVSTIINAITYVLIAFVSVSLIVSSIMIGIITYISVLERIKEIGVLRSIGASKKDIKNIFTAESLIIGLSAGLFGIFVTIMLCIPINIIINSLAGLSSIAVLPIVGAVVLIALSMLLTFIAGLLPARIASKKDPVVALRTE